MQGPYLGNQTAKPERHQALLPHNQLLALDGRDDEVRKDTLECRVVLKALREDLSATKSFDANRPYLPH